MSQKRSIFEDVSGAKSGAAPRTTGGIDAARTGSRGAVRVFLIVLFALVTVMILVGGLTRLTDSGLSITEWAPVTGAVPPLSEADWEAEFAKYREIPEYELQNAGMTLAEFKVIYWWEWGHRQLGRLIGLVWAVGLAGLLVARKVPRGWTPRLVGIGALGGVQGAIGWWMVSSGLEGTMLDVASYRLAVHLGLAFAILGLAFWWMRRLGRSEAGLIEARRGGEPRLFALGTGLMHLGFLQILLGALVAGIDAGRAFPEWPLMAGGILPPDPFLIEPFWRNFFEDAGLVQFMHRTAGYLLLILGVVAWVRARRSAHARTRFAFNAVLAMLLVQVAWGIVTVLYQAPLGLAIVHQAGAILTWVLILNARFSARFPAKQSVRG